MKQLLETIKEVAKAERLLAIEGREEGRVAATRGDFEGSVKATWVRLDQSGAGIVRYKGKDYKVRTIGFLSVSKGTIVELSYANGTYFAKF